MRLEKLDSWSDIFVGGKNKKKNPLGASGVTSTITTRRNHTTKGKTPTPGTSERRQSGRREEDSRPELVQNNWHRELSNLK
jgi:hypothetical protein